MILKQTTEKQQMNGIPIKEQENHNTQGFDVNPENINKAGRTKKIYTILKEMGYGADDIKTAMGEVAWYTEEEALLVANNKANPIIVRTIAKQYIQALTKNDMTKLREILEYQIPKPKQDLGLETTQPLIVFKEGQESDVDKVSNL